MLAEYLEKSLSAARKMEQAEEAMISALSAYNVARDQLEAGKMRVICDEKKITGKNPETREAQLYKYLKDQYRRVDNAKKIYHLARAKWHYERQCAEIWTLAGYFARKEAEFDGVDLSARGMGGED